MAETADTRYPAKRQADPVWVAAHGIGAALLMWIALANGFPLLFADSGSYLRVGTETFYPLDRPVAYGLLIAPVARYAGLWAIIIGQALFTSWLVGQVLIAVTARRSATMLVLVLATLAGLSSLPWFVGQIMPDLFTPLMALTLYMMLFAPYSGWRAWMMAALLTGQITLHLSHIPIAAALIGLGGLVLAWQNGWQAATARLAPAAAAWLTAVLGLCSVNLLATDNFRPTLQSDKFLVARVLDGKIGQPVLDRLCATEQWRLCRARAFVERPGLALPGQDYLWATESPRAALEHDGPTAFRAEEGAFARRVLRENPVGVLRVALLGWREQLVRVRAADGMVAYPPQMQVAKQIHRHFREDSAAFDKSRQQQGTLQRLALAPDRAIGLLVVLLAPFVVWSAVRRGDHRMVALATVILGTIVSNAAVCGILSGPADRYQSRVLWLLPLFGLIALARRTSLPKRRDYRVSIAA